MNEVKRNVIELTADVTHIEKMLRRGTVEGFTVFSDERVFGGDGSAPEPLMYFTLAAGF